MDSNTIPAKSKKIFLIQILILKKCLLENCKKINPYSLKIMLKFNRYFYIFDILFIVLRRILIILIF